MTCMPFRISLHHGCVADERFTICTIEERDT